VVIPPLDTFTGNPAEQIIGPPFPFDIVHGPGTLGGGTFELSIQSGAGTFWNVTTAGVDVIRGSWTAAPHVETVPEATTLMLLMSGVAVMRLGARRRGTERQRG
jgi:hypothetical protein